jgi:lysophospholipase L1-like esterase
MKLFCSIILTIAALAGCAKKQAAMPVAITMPEATDTTKTYLALGDSYTVGEAVPQGESYPFQLMAQLKADGFKLDTPTVIATTGWTTQELIDATNAYNFTGKKYDLVTLLIGVNDQYQGISIDTYHANFITLLNKAMALAKNKSHVIVISIPDYGVTPFAQGNDAVIGPQIDAFNAIGQSEALKAGVAYLNITDISRLAAKDPTLIATDGLHPSGKMYQMWVQRLAPMVEKMIY